MAPHSTDARPGRIFLSYRRDDTGGFAPGLHSLLADHFGEASVFWDVDAASKLRKRTYREYLAKRLGSHDVVVALIGLDWATARDSQGRRHLDAPEDFHRQELEVALDRDIALIPVLVDGAPMPTAAELPPTLARLAETQAHELTSRQFLNDVKELIRRIERVQSDGGERAGHEVGDGAGRDVLEQDLMTAAQQRSERGQFETARQTAALIDDAGRREEALSSIAEDSERRDTDTRQLAQTLPELLRSAGLRYSQVGDTLAVPYRPGRADQLTVTARMLGGEQDLAFFSVDLPSPSKFGKEAAYRNLLQVSFEADYVKAMMTSGGELRLAAELRPQALTPPVVRGVVDGLARLGDVTSGDLRDSGWRRRLEENSAAQAHHIDVDGDEAMRAIPKLLESAGLEVTELDPGVFATKLTFGDTAERYPVAFRLRRTAISLIAFTPLKPKGDTTSFLHLLELNRVASVAKVGLDQAGELALLYEVPTLHPSLMEDVQLQFGLLLLGVLGLEAAS